MSTVAQDPQEFFKSCQKRLGPDGRLGVSALLFDPNGERRAHIGFNEDDRFPMASVVKVPIGMLIACEIANRTLSVDEKIRIHSRTASPGLIGNPLDRFYFLPLAIVRTHTVEQLMAFMLHHSDNTATDAILHRLGGICALTNFLRDLQIEGISIKRTMHELLTYYYVLQPSDVTDEPHPRATQGIGRILANIRRMTPAFRCRPDREEHLIRTGEETCTPRAMAQLLKLLTLNSKYALVYSHMQRCATNKRRIAEGLKEQRVFVKSFGHKTGSLGAIANDVGILHLKNGYFAALAVMTCHSAVRMPVRDNEIATVTRAVIGQWKTEQLFESS